MRFIKGKCGMVFYVQTCNFIQAPEDSAVVIVGQDVGNTEDTVPMHLITGAVIFLYPRVFFGWWIEKN